MSGQDGLDPRLVQTHVFAGFDSRGESAAREHGHVVRYGASAV